MELTSYPEKPCETKDQTSVTVHMVSASMGSLREEATACLGRGRAGPSMMRASQSQAKIAAFVWDLENVRACKNGFR